TWDDDTKEIIYCGTVLTRKDFTWTLNQEGYIHKVKPVTVHRNRAPEEEVNEYDRSQLRALLGSLQWPAVHSSPHLQCSCSLTAGKMAQNKLQAIVDANSLLRFAKQNADIALKYEPIPMNSFSELRL
ncbi:Copia protein, partial [Durusdinium trenchii]